MHDKLHFVIKKPLKGLLFVDKRNWFQKPSSIGATYIVDFRSLRWSLNNQ
jgi:hypothetical protein